MPEQNEGPGLPAPAPGSENRPQLNESCVAWTVLKELRDKNEQVAAQADLLMKAIEKCPALDAAMCITMGIRPKLVPPQMGGKPS